MSTATLTSLAMLKVHINQGNDYLDYLRPFILQVIIDDKLDSITEQLIEDGLRKHFGLEIPNRSIQIVLRRLSRTYPIKKEEGAYRIIGRLPESGITSEKSRADRHILAVLYGLMEFSKQTTRVLESLDDAVTFICEFLEEFNVQCLRYYLRGTTIPTVNDKHKIDVILVSQYVMHLQKYDPERFESFMIMAQGHMLANALLCPDLKNAPRTYKGVVFYFDTPLLVQCLGLEGEPKKTAVENLINILKQLGARVGIFSHSRDELERVLIGAADHINSPNGRGNIVLEARRQGVSKSDLLLVAGKIDEMLLEAKIEIFKTPKYIAEFQIDENAFEMVLDDEVSYHNPRAKENDINSVRSIYVLRKGTSPSYLEKSKAVLVSSNSGFAQAAWEYGQKHEESREVSAVIDDFSLANLAWLKVPMGAPNIPTAEVLAFSYAALQPSRELLSKFMMEIDKLEKEGKFSERDHQLLRSATLANEELMHLTLGSVDAVNEQTVTETLSRVTSEIKKEESEKYSEERQAHLKTKKELSHNIEETRRVQTVLYWRCHRKANIWASAITGIIMIFLICGLIAGFNLHSTSPILGWILTLGTAIGLIFEFIGIIFGTTVKRLHSKMKERFLARIIKKEALAIGLDISEYK